MNPKLKKLMLPFYFGSISEEERLFVEREMLTDSEVLVDYLDLKRRVEAAYILASHPSQNLWEVIRPTTPAQRRAWLSLSIGAALAAGIALLFMLQPMPKTTEMVQPSANRVLFDSNSELPASSGVL